MVLSFFAISCDSDDPKPEPTPDPKELTYAQTTLSYSGSALHGKTISLAADESLSTATLTLYGVLPTEAETVVEGITLHTDGETYTFSASGISSKGITFNVSGSLADEVLAVALTDVQIPSNPLTQQGTFPILEYAMSDPEIEVNMDDPDNMFMSLSMSGKQSMLINWTVTNEKGEEENLFDLPSIGTDLSASVQDILAKLIYLVLDRVTFLPDVNITARYAPLHEDINIMSLMFQSPTESDRGTFTDSPLNLCRYFVEGNAVYIQPDLDMILYTIQQNSTRSGTTRATPDLSSLLELIPTLSRWLSEGITLNLISHDREEPFVISVDQVGMELKYYYYFDCDYRLCIAEEEILSLLPVLPTLGEMFLGDLELSFDFNGQTLDLNMVLEELMEKLSYPTTTFEAGLLF